MEWIYRVQPCDVVEVVEGLAVDAGFDVAAQPLDLMESHRLSGGVETEPTTIGFHLVDAPTIGSLRENMHTLAPVESCRLRQQVNIDPEHWVGCV